MKNLIFILVCMMSVAFAGCGRQSDMRLVEADSLMSSHPDSAYELLKQVDSRQLSRRDRPYYALLFTMAQYKNYDKIPSDSLIDIAVDYYDSGDRQVEALIFKGAALQDMGYDSEAIDWYKKAESVTPPTDYETLGYINMRLGDLYSDVYIDNNVHVEKYKKALRYYTLSGNKKYQGACIGMLGAFYRSINMDSAYVYLNKAVDLSRQERNYRSVYSNLALLARAYYVDSMYMKSKDIAISVIKNKDKYKSDDNIYYDAVASYAALGMVDSARYYFPKVSEKNLTRQQKVIRMMALVKLLYEEHRYKDAFDLDEVCTRLADSLTHNEDKAELFELEKRYDKQKVEFENAIMKQHQERIIFFTVLCGIIFVVCFLSLYSRYRRRLRDALLLQESFQKEKKLVMDKLMKNQKVSDELKLALNEQLKLTRNVISASDEFGNHPDLFLKKFKQILKTGGADWRFWDNMFNLTNSMYDDILEKIAVKFPVLHDHELRLICLLVCDFNIAEIAVCMEFTNRYSINNKKRTIAKKMGLENLSLDAYLEKCKSNHDVI